MTAITPAQSLLAIATLQEEAQTLITVNDAVLRSFKGRQLDVARQSEFDKRTAKIDALTAAISVLADNIQTEHQHTG